MADTENTPASTGVVKVQVKGAIFVPFKGKGVEVVNAFTAAAELTAKVKLALENTPGLSSIEFSEPTMTRVKLADLPPANKPEAPPASE